MTEVVAPQLSEQAASPPAPGSPLPAPATGSSTPTPATGSFTSSPAPGSPTPAPATGSSPLAWDSREADASEYNMVALDKVTDKDIIIALMGPTGAGKSSFIASITNDNREGVGHDLTSFTSDIKATKVKFKESSVVLLDTPGFNDTKKSDLDILNLIFDWLNAKYQTSRPILSAILYFHRISDNRMTDTPLKNLRAFEKLCGENVMSKVILVTTMWDEVDTDVGAERLKELKDHDWKVMISGGSTTFECVDARGSPVELLRQIVQRKKEHDWMGEGEGNGYVPQVPRSSLRMRRSGGIWRDGAVMTGGRAKDIIIALMGPTGSGKSSFIANVTKQEGNGVGHDLTSCTSEIKVSECDVEGFSIVLVDTPGSDHTNTSDLDILKLISDWLNAEYQTSQPTLSAILYFHRISDNRMAGTPLKNLRVFEKLCGKNAMSKVTLVTTMWDEVDMEVGQERLKELKESYWKAMVSRGSTTFECEDTQGSPMKLLRQIVQRKKEQELAGESEGKVQLQEEISDMKLELQQTAAGQQLCTRLEELEQRRVEALRKVREGTRRADAKTAEDLWREYNELKNQLDSTLTQARELRMTLVQRFKKSFRSVLSSLKRGRRRTPSTAPRLRVPRPTSPDRATI